MGRRPRTLKVKCPTWDHVETFYLSKLRGGRTLAIRVPFSPVEGDSVTLGLELPNDMVMAIDGAVVAVKPAPDGKRSAIQLHLVGMTPEVLERLRTLVEDARAAHPVTQGSEAVPPAAVPPKEPRERPGSVPPVAMPEDAPVDEVVEPMHLPGAAELDDDERHVYVELGERLRRLREAGAHEVLGVPWDAGVEEIRAAYFGLVKGSHPDVFSRYGSQAIRHLAQEIFIHVNKAYDRMRDALVASGAAITAGPALLPHTGWLATFDDIATDERDKLSEKGLFGDIDLAAEQRGEAHRAIGPADRSPAHDPGLARLAELEAAARELLDGDDLDAAMEKLAEALTVEPRNRRLRALYHVATGRAALARGQTAQATSQFEAALAHDRGCAEARAQLDELRHEHGKRGGLFKRLFR